MSNALVTCITPTARRTDWLQHAAEYLSCVPAGVCEWIVVLDDGDQKSSAVAGAVHPDQIVVRAGMPIGAKRNLACRRARGDIIIHWDDDDWYAPWRIEYQVEELLRSGADICGADRLLYYEPQHERAWEYVYPPRGRPWVAGNTLCYRKGFWEQHPFPEINVGEDSRFVWACAPARVHRHTRCDFVVGLIHDGNTSPKRTVSPPWHPRPVADVERLLGPAMARYRKLGVPNRCATESTLVAAGSGVGDILRITPLVRALHQMGHQVDVLIAADYAETAALLEGAPEIHRLMIGAAPGTDRYDTAIFTFWGLRFRRTVAAKRVHAHDRRNWLVGGDTRWMNGVAAAMGWEGPLPAPFARHSGRGFELRAGTVALHPGCKPDWPWKKWHQFDELAATLNDVVVVGLPGDLDNSGTWFKRAFEWPPHVRNYVGQLSLADTAALLSQCAALVSNDSGLMHLAAALGVPTLGVFGITSPERELMAVDWMKPISKGLPCERACRQQPWGRHDCERHLECMKTLSADEVRDGLAKLLNVDSRSLAALPSVAAVGARRTSPAGPRVIYHGPVFDSSGYGQAARAYIHALHAAGVELSVVNLTAGEPKIRDDLVESLVGREVRADFQLYHGVPPLWAKDAFRHRHYIAMTVWETNAMPPEWREPLRRALDVWLPCDFNVAVFERELGRSVLKLPHPVPPVGSVCADPAFLTVAPDEFLFYSIFEWQDRKGPVEQIDAFLRAFTASDRAVLLLKSTPKAGACAQSALAVMRARTGSDARVLLECESWNEAQIAALHTRGDCYVSLHRGEGWGYPLFEAALRGTPTVATAYSGPLEYLDSSHHELVSYREGPVRQRYVFYNRSMLWAEPDVADAAHRLRWVFEHRDDARTRASAHACVLRARYAAGAVGTIARDRLMDLLRQIDRQRWVALGDGTAPASASIDAPAPLVPIPASWFDEDYFEHGRKSNWKRGYSWQEFSGLFRETAAFLCSLFPSARTYLDAGCGKGFLVRALRESEREAWGCDISPWAFVHAEDAARDYLSIGPAEETPWEGEHDVLTAFHLLTQMSEAQIDCFLRRARERTRMAVLAVIPLIDESCGKFAAEGDLGHVTRRPRLWWHERFLAAGWRQDPLHRAMEQVCQAHPLPRRMGWDLFLYSPGQ
jgi:ADP-heptose:LPS heptosyltransferase/glycosyltransferase involved in cell wall biosynthesis